MTDTSLPTAESVPDGDDGRLRYRLLTGPDDVAFCTRVSAALDEGYELYGDPAATFNGDRVIVAQAVVLPRRRPTRTELV